MSSVAVFFTLMLITWVAGFPEMGHCEQPFSDGLGTQGSSLLHSVWVMSLSVMASGFIGVVTHGRTSFSLRPVTLLRCGYSAFHYVCILGSSVCQWTAVCGSHTWVVLGNDTVDTGLCLTPGGPDAPFSGFPLRNGSKENGFSSALVVKNSPANTGDRISVFSDISRG